MSNNIPKVVGEGTYGCVHKPSLKCKDEEDIKDPNKVSKLMTKGLAKTEFKLIKEFDSILSKIPNHTMYFRTYNIQKCTPRKLTRKDLTGFTKKCKALQKRGITKKNIRFN